MKTAHTVVPLYLKHYFTFYLYNQLLDWSFVNSHCDAFAISWYSFFKCIHLEGVGDNTFFSFVTFSISWYNLFFLSFVEIISHTSEKIFWVEFLRFVLKSSVFVLFCCFQSCFIQKYTERERSRPQVLRLVSFFCFDFCFLVFP